MLKSRLCDYSDAYIRVSGTIAVAAKGANDSEIAADGDNKQELSF